MVINNGMVLVSVDDETHNLIKEAKLALINETQNEKLKQSDAIKKWLKFAKTEAWKEPRVVL
jgi:heterodisulfide reductase subunit C